MRRTGVGRAPERGESGASAVEFAVVLPLLLLFIFGIIEFGLAFNRVHSFQAAASEAGRAAAVGYTRANLENPGQDPNDRIRRIAGSTVDPEDVEVLVVGDPCGPPSGGGEPEETVTVSVRLRPSAAPNYRMRIPGVVFGSDPDYESVAVRRCEVGR